MALYGEGGKRWALTERGRHHVGRDRASLRIGPSTLSWDGRALEVRIDEVTAPLPSRIRGRVRLETSSLFRDTFPLDVGGLHRWRPIAPCAHVEVVLDRPALRFAGRAYLDTNQGDEPLENAFESWQWSRSALRDGSTAVLYDVRRRRGEPLCLSLRIDPAGGQQRFAPPPRIPLPRTAWRLSRWTRADPGRPARLVQTLEDTPFYARSLLTSEILGEAAPTVHESLSLERFRSRWVQWLLPFRAPRSPIGPARRP